MATLERRIAAVESKNPGGVGPDVIFVTFMTTAEHREAAHASISRTNGGSIDRDADESEAAFLDRVASRARENLPSGQCALVFMLPDAKDAHE